MGARESELGGLFSEAEKRRSCLATCDARLRDALRRAMMRGEAIRPAKGVYARTAYWDRLPDRDRSLHVLRALQQAHPNWVFCSSSAAVAYDMPVPFASMSEIHVATSRSRRNRAAKDVAFHAMPEGEPVFSVAGINVVSFERTLFDCMRAADFGRALAFADVALRSGRSKGKLLAYFREVGWNCSGALRAERALLYADGRSESAGESVARANMIELGFALPDLQVSFERPLERNRSYRVDFLWMREDGTRVIGEFDGRGKYEDAALRGNRSAVRVLEDERKRESLLSLYGMPIVRFSYRDVTDKAYFARLLESFGIPRRVEAAEEHRRMERSRLLAAKTFSIAPF